MPASSASLPSQSSAYLGAQKQNGHDGEGDIYV